MQLDISSDFGSCTYVMVVTASGFTGSCSTFNGTYRPKFCGACPTAVSSGFCCYIHGFTGGAYVLAAWGIPTGQQFAVIYFDSTGTEVARYGYGECNPTSLTLTKISSTCPSAPATITYVFDKNTGPANCDCFSHLPIPSTLHLTITNSTCSAVPNGVYALTYYGPFDENEPVYAIKVGDMDFTFYPPPNDGSAPGCAKITLSCVCGSPFAVCDNAAGGDGESATTCSCSPFSAAGHYIVQNACCTCIVNDSFDWSVAP